MIDGMLFTETDIVRLLANALADDVDHVPVAKLFMPDGAATWLISELDPDDPDRVFGLCDLGLGFPEVGYVSLIEISSLRGRLGLPVERDMLFVGLKPLSDYAEDARRSGKIVT